MIKQFLAGELLLQALQTPLVSGFDEFVNQSCGCREANLQALLASGQTKAQSSVSLARAARTKGDHILPLVDEFAAGELHGQRLVQGWDGLEVEAVQALGCRELGGLDAALDHPTLTLDQLQLAKAQQILHMILVLGSALPGQLGVFGKEGRQAELLEIVLQQDFRRIGHDAAPAIRLI